MPRRPAVSTEHTTAIDAGDMEFFHPHCRKRILVTTMNFIGGSPAHPERTRLFVEGICPHCDCYVRLLMTKTGLEG